MKILYNPQRADEKITYTFRGETIVAEHNGKSDIFDFSSVPEGRMRLFDDEGNSLMETVLDVNPIMLVMRVDGILHVELINYIGEDATDNERYPDWLNVTD